ncbi:uncharacterized protein Z520_02169 [Fonsecaea multimorphosa CBS 102226]|uniref:Uncharacterized protein n=1 Tax=Fonsecaea multimorphosa CBS 102226 TaxID=1442371 RepID=A0A0D2HJG1_9EURO|nr:uncharacterized protein Z520_02169 [Fonsecaea multimorphosa CBS 102226]KIY02031.1 hypothetical protein Z520_02169 [Fonsecaea multimorphosa CBS 102226]
MDIPTSHSSPEPRTTRPLYPDLPSAYAQIQGRRAASLQPTSSNRSATRFPLSASSSSSEEDGFQALPLDSDAIPLKNLPCRKVHSAQGILHEANYHQESSAVFETSEDNSDPKLDRKRASTTLDDILSQYADVNLTRSRSHNENIGNAGYVEAEHLNPVIDRGFAGDAACFGTLTRRPGHVDLRHHLHGSYQHGAEDQIPQNPESFGANDDDDEDWLTMPESSRSGFLTPSKLRFRLAKRGTADTSNSSLTGRRSPASPWDPLQFKPRSQQRYKGPLNTDQHQRSPSPKAYEDKTSGCGQWLHKGSKSVTTTGQIAEADERDCRLDSARASTVKAQHHSQLRPRPLKPIPSAHLTSQSPSTRSPTLSSSRRIKSALPSSSLLPRIPDHAHTSKTLSSRAMATLNRTPGGPQTDQTLTLPSIYDDSANTSTATTADSHLGALPLHSRIATANNAAFIGEHVETAGSAGTLDPFVSPSIHGLVPRHNIRKTYVSSQEAEGLAARQYNEGGYKFNDAEISRFLRDSRLLRQRFDHRHEHGHNNVLLGRQGILATGSSLADLSSDSTALSRLRHARTPSSGSNYDTSDDRVGITNQVTRKFKQFLSGTGPGATDGASSEYSSLGRVHTSTNGTSHSLTLEEPEESVDTSDPAICCDRYPSFPIAPEMLGVVRLENLARVPFERLQLWDDGEWLEKGWCFVHERMEYSHAVLVGNEAGISEDLRGSVQRKAGRILLVFGAATFLLGGWTLIHSIGEGGPLATSAMADVTRLLAGGEEVGVVCCVHPVDAAMAQAIEKAAVWVVVLAVVGVLAVLCWGAATF